MATKIGRPPKSISERFWMKVQKTRGCWYWTSNEGGKTLKYGMLSVPQGHEGMAHRISWEIHFGKIPEGLLVLHKCDNPKCVKPSHLFLGTPQDNMDDMVRKRRSLYGEKSPQAKLSAIQVERIRKLYTSGKYSQQKLGEMFGVHQTNIGFIVRLVNWRKY